MRLFLLTCFILLLVVPRATATTPTPAPTPNFITVDGTCETQGPIITPPIKVGRLMVGGENITCAGHVLVVHVTVCLEVFRPSQFRFFLVSCETVTEKPVPTFFHVGVRKKCASLGKGLKRSWRKRIEITAVGRHATRTGEGVSKIAKYHC